MAPYDVHDISRDGLVDSLADILLHLVQNRNNLLRPTTTLNTQMMPILQAPCLILLTQMLL